MVETTRSQGSAKLDFVVESLEVVFEVLTSTDAGPPPY